MRNHFPGGPELLDDKEASRFLHQHALALVVYGTRSDDKTDRDAANELVLVDRKQNTLLTSCVRAITDKSDDLGAFAAFWSPFVDLPAQSLIQRGLPLAPVLFPRLLPPIFNSCVQLESGPASRRYTIEPAAQPSMRRSSVLPEKGTPPTGLEQGAEATAASP
jgi:hypothetical protein